MTSNTDRSCNGCGRLRVGRLPLSSSRSPEGALEHLLEASLHQEANPQKFLDALELLSVVQQVDFADRSYRQVFTENYRVLFQKSRHLYRLELWEACQDNFESVAVNGRIYIIDGNTRLKVRGFFMGDWRPSGSQQLLDQLSPLLSRFDQAWTDFEASYVAELMRIEVEARRPMERAVKLERQLQFFDAVSGPSRPKTRRSPAASEEDQVQPSSPDRVRRLSLASSDSVSADSAVSYCWDPPSTAEELPAARTAPASDHGSMGSFELGGEAIAMARAIRDQSEEARGILTALCQEVSQMNSCANLHGHGRDDMTEEVLVAASSLLLRNGGSGAEAAVRRFLAAQVLSSFAEVRSYLASISNFVMEVDPQLACNTLLVKALSSWEEAWELGERLLLNEGMLQALSAVAALFAGSGAPAELKRMLEDQDAELFLVLPRLVVLCSLSDERNAEVLRIISSERPSRVSSRSSKINCSSCRWKRQRAYCFRWLCANPRIATAAFSERWRGSVLSCSARSRRSGINVAWCCLDVSRWHGLKVR
mmetsp:Transcript_14542/g.31288  ORF Transcript_14542/g.31288 Transcript_14542/m.31288 type:complete len:537 (+) Transcript_14542:46-1656(+)